MDYDNASSTRGLTDLCCFTTFVLQPDCRVSECAELCRRHTRYWRVQPHLQGARTVVECLCDRQYYSRTVSEFRIGMTYPEASSGIVREGRDGIVLAALERAGVQRQCRATRMLCYAWKVLLYWKAYYTVLHWNGRGAHGTITADQQEPGYFLLLRRSCGTLFL